MTERPSEEPMTLARLLRLAMGEVEARTKGGRYEIFAQRMPIDPDTNQPTPGAKNLEKLITQPLKGWPDPQTIKNLAIGTGFTEQQIMDACATSLGITITRRPPSTLEMLLPSVGDLDRLSDAEVSAVLALLRVQVQSHERGGPRG